MKIVLTMSLVLWLSMCGHINAQDFQKPELGFVCELKVTTDPLMTVGQTAHGERRIIPITGGTFEGPNMRGTVLSGGADYQYADAEGGRIEIEAIYTIKTDDGVLIHIRNVGLVYTPEELRNLEPRDFTKIYFRAAPKFEAPEDSPYEWLNNAIFICRAVPSDGYVSIQVWQVL